MSGRPDSGCNAFRQIVKKQIHTTHQVGHRFEYKAKTQNWLWRICEIDFRALQNPVYLTIISRQCATVDQQLDVIRVYLHVILEEGIRLTPSVLHWSASIDF